MGRLTGIGGRIAEQGGRGECPVGERCGRPERRSEEVGRAREHDVYYELMEVMSLTVFAYVRIEWFHLPTVWFSR